MGLKYVASDQKSDSAAAQLHHYVPDRSGKSLGVFGGDIKGISRTKDMDADAKEIENDTRSIDASYPRDKVRLSAVGGHLCETFDPGLEVQQLNQELKSAQVLWQPGKGEHDQRENNQNSFWQGSVLGSHQDDWMHQTIFGNNTLPRCLFFTAHSLGTCLS